MAQAKAKKPGKAGGVEEKQTNSKANTVKSTASAKPKQVCSTTYARSQLVSVHCLVATKWDGFILPAAYSACVQPSYICFSGVSLGSAQQELEEDEGDDVPLKESDQEERPRKRRKETATTKQRSKAKTTSQPRKAAAPKHSALIERLKRVCKDASIPVPPTVYVQVSMNALLGCSSKA